MSRLLPRHTMLTEKRWVPQPATAPPTIPIYEPVAEPDYATIATEVREQACLEAEAIVAAARLEADAIRRQAREEGLQEGRATGRQEYDEKMTGIQGVVDDINWERQEFFTRAEPELVRLSVAVAEQILTRQLTIDPELIVEIARAQMQRIRERETLTLRANPHDVPLLMEAQEYLLSQTEGMRRLNLVEDRRVEHGGLIIEGDNGALDARISTQLEAVRSALHEAAEAPHDADEC